FAVNSHSPEMSAAARTGSARNIFQRTNRARAFLLLFEKRSIGDLSIEQLGNLEFPRVHRISVCKYPNVEKKVSKTYPLRQVPSLLRSGSEQTVLCPLTET